MNSLPERAERAAGHRRSARSCWGPGRYAGIDLSTAHRDAPARSKLCPTTADTAVPGAVHRCPRRHFPTHSPTHQDSVSDGTDSHPQRTLRPLNGGTFAALTAGGGRRCVGPPRTTVPPCPQSGPDGLESGAGCLVEASSPAGAESAPAWRYAGTGVPSGLHLTAGPFAHDISAALVSVESSRKGDHQSLTRPQTTPRNGIDSCRCRVEIGDRIHQKKLTGLRQSPAGRASHPDDKPRCPHSPTAESDRCPGTALPSSHAPSAATSFVRSPQRSPGRAAARSKAARRNRSSPDGHRRQRAHRTCVRMRHGDTRVVGTVGTALLDPGAPAVRGHSGPLPGRPSPGQGFGAHREPPLRRVHRFWAPDVALSGVRRHLDLAGLRRPTGLARVVRIQ